MKKNGVDIINLGCRLNIFEGEVINSLIQESNIENYTIINSCAVTEKAEKKVVYEIRKSKKNYPDKKIIITGCAAQINPKKYSEINEVNYVIGNKEKLDGSTWKNLLNSNSVIVDDIFANNFLHNNLVDKFEGKSRAYIEIQQGCDHRCTFCIIPFGRGNNRSVPVGVIVDRIKKLVENKYNEIVLTGVDITDYGKDLPGKPNLFQLIQRILNLVPGLKQLRLSSIDFAEITSEFWPLLKEKRVMPHFHLSLQAGNDLILKRMKRRHNRKQTIDFCNKIRSVRNDIALGADIIAGFPTETEKMFRDSLSMIEECHLTHLHIFPYSQREGTPAAKMPQVSREIVKKRAKLLREAGNKEMQKFIKKQIGNYTFVLIEEVKNNTSIGKSQNYIKTKIDKKIEIGEIVKCQITNFRKDVLIGKTI